MIDFNSNGHANTRVMDEKLYDLCMIEQLCRGNHDQVKKMVAVFISQVPEAVEEIKSAFHNRDFSSIKQTAHRIKPTLSYYAIVKIIKDIQQIETMAEEGVASAALEMKIQKLDTVTTEVIELMKKDFLIN